MPRLPERPRPTRPPGSSRRPRPCRGKSPTLSILIGPTVEHSLFDVAVGASRRCASWTLAASLPRFGNRHERLDGRRWAAKAARWKRRRWSPASRDALALDARIRAEPSALLISSQNEDGGWSWTGGQGGSESLRLGPCPLGARPGAQEPATTCRRSNVQQGRRPGAKPAGRRHGRKRLRKQRRFCCTRYRPWARPTSPWPIGSTASGTADVDRRARAIVALALAEMDRGPVGRRTARRPGQQAETSTTSTSAPHGAAKARSPGANRRPSFAGAVLMALERIGGTGSASGTPQSAQGQSNSPIGLMAHRVGYRWSPDKATGPADVGAVPVVRQEPLRGPTLRAHGYRVNDAAAYFAGDRSGRRHAARSTCPPPP